jgi:hypothetical protein
MILSGTNTENNKIFNNIKTLKASTKLKYILTNRIDSKTTPNEIAWGNSVIIGIDNNYSGKSYTQLLPSNDSTNYYIKIFDITSEGLKFKVLNASPHWLLISMMDSTNTISFNDYKDLKNPADNNYKILYEETLSRNVRLAEVSKNYQDLNVIVKALDTIKIDTLNFGSMNMKVDTLGNIIVYNLSTYFFNSIEENNINNILFDLCLNAENYEPIIRGLKFEEKIKDLNYLIFSYYTNNGKQYIIFTTKSHITDYALYPDFFVSNNLYNDISNDVRVPSLYDNLNNDLFLSELLDMFDYTTNFKDTITNIINCKELFEGDVIENLLYNYTTDVEFLKSYTVLNYDNYHSNIPVIVNSIDDSLTITITYEGSDIFKYTSIETDWDTKINVGDLVDINLLGTGYNVNNNGIFEVITVGTNYFEITNTLGAENECLITEGYLHYSPWFVQCYNGKIFLYSKDEMSSKSQNLTSLQLTFSNTSKSTKQNIRQIFVYYEEDSTNREILYQCYLPLITFFADEVKTFRILLNG